LVGVSESYTGFVNTNTEKEAERNIYTSVDFHREHFLVYAEFKSLQVQY